MPLHESAQTMMDLMAAVGLGDIGPDTPPQDVRAKMEAATGAMPPPPVHAVADQVLDTTAGPVPVRIYRPSDDANLPILMWLHGGGWVIGSVNSHDALCRQMCGETGAMIVSVDYRLAPEAKFPGPLDDCVGAWEWIARNAASIGGDPARIAIGGDSAGGNLAAVTCLLARDTGLPLPKLQLLVYPVTDYEFESDSMRDNAKGYFLEADHMRWFFDYYTNGDDEKADWRVSPMRAPDLSGLPPALVLTAEYDPLRDQGEAYARRLAEAGCLTEAIRIDGAFHGCFGLHEMVEPAKEPWDKSIAAVRHSLGVS